MSTERPSQTPRPSSERHSSIPIPLTRRKTEEKTDPRRERLFLVDVGSASIGSSNHITGKNEDYAYCNAGYGLMLTADGMGSGPAPHLASRMLADIVQDIIKRTDGHEGLSLFPILSAPLTTSLEQGEVETALTEMMLDADAAIRYQAENDPAVAISAVKKFEDVHGVPYDPQKQADVRELQYMMQHAHGTTQIMAKFWQDEARQRFVTVAAVGDSRLYRVRKEQLDQLTKDDSLIQVCLDAGLITTGELDRLPRLVTAHVERLSHDPYLDAETRTWLHFLVKNNTDKDGKQSKTFPLSKYASMVLNALGGGPGTVATPRVETHSVEAGDIYLGVSDGVTKVMTDAQIQHFFELYRSLLNAHELAEQLLTVARELADAQPELMDDITVTCVKCP